MHIVVVSEHYWPEVGGAEVMMRQLAHQWAADGHQVTVLTKRWIPDSPPSQQDQGTTVHRQSVSRFRVVGTLLGMRRIRSWIARHHPNIDLLYGSMLKFTTAAMIQAGKRWRIPTVARPEGASLTGDIHWQNHSRGGRHARRWTLQADSFVVLSDEIEAEMIESGYPKEKMACIPNGVRIPRKIWTVDQVPTHQRDLNLPERPTVVFVGRLHQDKGVQDLIQAIAELDVHLVVVGDGPARGPLQQLAHQLGVDNRVTFVGQTANVGRYLRAGHLFCLPSYQEGLSISLLEAAALGMPVLASNIDANRGLLPAEMLRLFPTKSPKLLAQAIQVQFANPPNSALLASQRQMVSEKFSIDSVARAHLDLFDQLQK